MYMYICYIVDSGENILINNLIGYCYHYMSAIGKF